MLVSHRHRFIYTKTFKTGGTSVESYFEPCCVPPGQLVSSEARDEIISADGVIGFRGPKPPKGCRFWNHMSAQLIRERIGDEIWNRYFKFCIIRNPFEKAMSAFYWILKHSKSPSIDSADLDSQRAELERWLQRPDSQILIDRDKYMIDGAIGMDAFIRYENLSAELAELCTKFGVPWEPARLPNFKSGVRPSTARAENLFTFAARQRVEEMFAFELSHFGYAFPSGER